MVRLGTMPYFIKLYISTVAYKAIPTLIFNVILMWLNATQKYPKNIYRAYKALFRPRKEIQWGII